MSSFFKIHVNAVINTKKASKEEYRWILDFLRAKERGETVDMSSLMPEIFSANMTPQEFSENLNSIDSNMCVYLNNYNPIKIFETDWITIVSFDASFKHSHYTCETVAWFLKEMQKIVSFDKGIFAYIQHERDNEPEIFIT